LHCYSWSHPQARSRIEIGHFLAAISDAAKLGYTNLSISGGEPLLYNDIGRLLHQAKDIGLSTSVVSNGYLVSQSSYLDVAELIDTLVLSIDGEPETHNRMRASPRAFSMLVKAIEALSAMRRPFGLIHTVTRENWNSLGWVISFACEHAACLLQFHPLEMAGRATETMCKLGLTPSELLKLFVLTHVTGQVIKGTVLEVDLAHVTTLRDSPESFYQPIGGTVFDGGPPGSPLVIEDDGTVSPYVYGLNRAYALGNIQTMDLSSIVASARCTGRAAQVDSLCRSVRQRLIRRSRHPVVNWHEQLYRASHASVGSESRVRPQ
jgi:MoaA/NifB/PqqE/SkfB family radical SAM enzyme